MSMKTTVVGFMGVLVSSGVVVWVEVGEGRSVAVLVGSGVSVDVLVGGGVSVDVFVGAKDWDVVGVGRGDRVGCGNAIVGETAVAQAAPRTPSAVTTSTVNCFISPPFGIETIDLI